ncbi:hypothetical protein KIN20_030310 [Parelaphostrongylus tenuis]|uniref:Uncharacterized protein n=1 Tax=Parelaphostrongylus tenuis TaxID=148309 RepID=A0AAD5WG19_PARTN|nr:hypothetical protein KIN20_030310 [Parelaphostrongylus tenuis]
MWSNATGQAVTRNFTVSGFKLPTAMVFTASASAPVQLSGGIAATSEGAKSFVSRLVMQTMIEVLRAARSSAGLPDAINLSHSESAHGSDQL